MRRLLPRAWQESTRSRPLFLPCPSLAAHCHLGSSSYAPTARSCMGQRSHVETGTLGCVDPDRAPSREILLPSSFTRVPLYPGVHVSIGPCLGPTTDERLVHCTSCTAYRDLISTHHRRSKMSSTRTCCAPEAAKEVRTPVVGWWGVVQGSWRPCLSVGLGVLHVLRALLSRCVVVVRIVACMIVCVDIVLRWRICSYLTLTCPCCPPVCTAGPLCPRPLGRQGPQDQ